MNVTGFHIHRLRIPVSKLTWSMSLRAQALSEHGNENGEPKLPAVITGGGPVPKGTHPREYLKVSLFTSGPLVANINIAEHTLLSQAMQRPKDEDPYRKKVMRYSSTYRHTGLIGH